MAFPDWIKNILPAVKTGETVYFRNHEGSYYDSMPSVWKKMCVPIQRYLMCIINCFFREDPPGESPWTKENVMSLVRFSSLDEIPKIKICQMVAKDHPEVIEGRRRLISVGVLDSEEAAEDSSIVHDDAAEIEEDGSGLVGGFLTEEVQDMQKASKSSSLSYNILKPSFLLTQVFEKNRTAHEPEAST